MRSKHSFRVIFLCLLILSGFAASAFAASIKMRVVLINPSESKNQKTESEGQYKARKNIAEANHDLNKAHCKVSSDGAVERACKADARAQEKKEKADAKLIHSEEKADIDAKTR